MPSINSLWLTGSVLLAAATMAPLPVTATPAERALIVAQAQDNSAAPDKNIPDKKKEQKKKGATPRHAPPRKPGPAPKAPPKTTPKPPAVQHKPPPPAVQRHAPPRPSRVAPTHKPTPPRPVQTAPVHKPVPPPAFQKKPAPSATKRTTPATQPKPRQQPAFQRKPPPPAVQRPAPSRPSRAAPTHKPTPPRPVQTAPVKKPVPPPAVQKKPAPSATKHTTPATQPKPRQQPAFQRKPPQATPPSRHVRPGRHERHPPPQPAAKQKTPTVTPRLAQPVKPRNAKEFIRKNNGQPQRTIQDVRKERRTTRQNGRTFIHEGDRTIVRGPRHTFIWHNEDQRFAIGARDVRVTHRNGETITVIVRPDGVHIISVTDRDGRLIRRIRRYPDGREIVIIDNRHFGPDADYFVDMPPPRIRIPYSRYVVDADHANEAEIYATLTAPPVEPIKQAYSLNQVRYGAPLRMLMPRLDLAIHFDSGAWQLTSRQVDRLSRVAEALNRAIDRNPREVFLIEGHTDAVGSEDDNLSLSDRRAEAVAVALTEAYGVPPENLVTQGYGEQELKVLTSGPSAANRRVAIRRITPLIDRNAQR